ncbi:WLM domain-containing protein [Entophlyctis helioformis]|nr:WLM domain-containing protein [Entophlyctis helioformis]
MDAIDGGASGKISPRDNEFIGSLRVLSRKSMPEQALELLQRIAAHVRPIMKSRALQVGEVEEFFPANEGLLGLNVNRGRTIRLRLRPASAESSFLGFEDVLGTMLHELTHNIHGAHDAKFYKYMDGLWDEYEQLMASGFQPEGARLGGKRIESEAVAKAAALASAERRRRINAIMLPAGGRRLGGSSSSGSSGSSGSGSAGGLSLGQLEGLLTPAQMAAMSAERRAKDQIWCGSCEGHADNTSNANHAAGSAGGVKRSRDDRQHADANQNEECVGGGSLHGVPPPHSAPLPNALRTPRSPVRAAVMAALDRAGQQPLPKKAAKRTARPISQQHQQHQQQKPQRQRISADSADDAASRAQRPRHGNHDPEPDVVHERGPCWTCPVCTVINTPLALQCECCLGIRPHNSNEPQ